MRLIAGDAPTLPWVRSRVWVWVGAGLGLALREGWVETSPETCIDPPTHIGPPGRLQSSCTLWDSRWTPAGPRSDSWRLPTGEHIEWSIISQVSSDLLTLSIPSSKRTFSQPFDPFTPKFKTYILPNFEGKCTSEVVRIGSIIISRPVKLRKTKFSILCGYIFWWDCRGNLKLITLGSDSESYRGFLQPPVTVIYTRVRYYVRHYRDIKVCPYKRLKSTFSQHF